MKYPFKFVKETKSDGVNFILEIDLNIFDEYHHGHPLDYIKSQLWLDADPKIVKVKKMTNKQIWTGNCKMK